jgi:hypothetical protein
LADPTRAAAFRAKRREAGGAKARLDADPVAQATRLAKAWEYARAYYAKHYRKPEAAPAPTTPVRDCNEGEPNRCRKKPGNPARQIAQI